MNTLDSTVLDVLSAIRKLEDFLVNFRVARESSPMSSALAISPVSS
jgi:hypothetical protein